MVDRRNALDVLLRGGDDVGVVIRLVVLMLLSLED